MNCNRDRRIIEAITWPSPLSKCLVGSVIFFCVIGMFFEKPASFGPGGAMFLVFSLMSALAAIKCYLTKSVPGSAARCHSANFEFPIKTQCIVREDMPVRFFLAIGLFVLGSLFFLGLSCAAFYEFFRSSL